MELVSPAANPTQQAKGQDGKEHEANKKQKISLSRPTSTFSKANYISCFQNKLFFFFFLLIYQHLTESGFALMSRLLVCGVVKGVWWKYCFVLFILEKVVHRYIRVSGLACLIFLQLSVGLFWKLHLYFPY